MWECIKLENIKVNKTQDTLAVPQWEPQWEHQWEVLLEGHQESVAVLL